jgi:hypothetical protein
MYITDFKSLLLDAIYRDPGKSKANSNILNFKIHFHFILQFTPKLPKRNLPATFPTKCSTPYSEESSAQTISEITCMHEVLLSERIRCVGRPK